MMPGISITQRTCGSRPSALMRSLWCHRGLHVLRTDNDQFQSLLCWYMQSQAISPGFSPAAAGDPVGQHIASPVLHGLEC
jgi:hypothetical protein